MESKKTQQIVHEAEITRQYARYKIPGIIEIDNYRYHLGDISMGGCSIRDFPKDYYEEKKFTIAKIFFKFDNNFEMVIDDLNIQFLSIRKSDEGKYIVGARFSNLNEYQYSVLNQIINAYVIGDIATVDDILQAVSRKITYPKKIKKKVDKKKADLILILIYIIIFFLVSFLFFTIYQKIFIVKTDNGYIDANMTSIRAPAPCRIEYLKKIEPNDFIKKNEVIAIAHLIAGGVESIISPIDGEVYEVNALNKEFRNTNEPIITLFPKKYSIYIVAMIDHELLKKISLGNVANVRVPNGIEFKAKIVHIESAQNIPIEKAKILGNVYNRPRDYDKIILKPMVHLSRKSINTPVYITIDTLFN